MDNLRITHDSAITDSDILKESDHDSEALLSKFSSYEFCSEAPSESNLLAKIKFSKRSVPNHPPPSNSPLDSAQNPNGNYAPNSDSVTASCSRAFRILNLCLGHKLRQRWSLDCATPRSKRKILPNVTLSNVQRCNSAEHAKLILDSASPRKASGNSARGGCCTSKIQNHES